jgi:riboflavin kinase/FMN adenylyltransferase
MAGNLEQANRFLGSPFQLRGTVVHGDERGRELGYPTANLVPDNALVYPGNGVYACRAAFEDGGEWRWWPAATNVGVRPTFVTGRGVLVEAFLLDFKGDLYDRELRIAFLARLRGERRFDTVDGLVEQMHRDVEDARAIAA